VNGHEFEWDARNEAHAAAHGVTPELTADISSRQAKVFPNRERRTGSHMMIGEDAGGRFWTIILLDRGQGRWRVITGWPSTPSEVRLYRMEGE
jgi:uncharacterized DUF497 family protein